MPEPPLLTARNPFALAEAIVGRPIDWNQFVDRRGYLEEVLQTPYEQLFDPRYASPVYVGAAVADARARQLTPSLAGGYADWSDDDAEYFHPVQGALGDGWLIAAMSSVAWSRPYPISANLFEFYDPETRTRHRFCKPSSPGETGWPALVETAYAMWRAGTTHDRPDLTVLNGGDPVHASAALMGRQPHYVWTAETSAASLIAMVKSHSDFYRTRNPMTAWTYGSGEESPDRVCYADANIAASHAYSVLGWTTGTRIVRNTPYRPDLLSLRSIRPADEVDYRWTLDWHRLLQQDYIVLRNPWGHFEAGAGELTGAISMRDVSFWRSVDLGNLDGVFAVDLPTFKSYFAGIGVAL